MELITLHKFNEKVIVLIRKSNAATDYEIVDVSNAPENLEWLPKLQEHVRNNSNILLLSQKNKGSGILGLVTCLRKELETHNIKCFFIADDAPMFDVERNIYRKQLKKNFTMNVYKNGQWGTYRHTTFSTEHDNKSEHVFLNVKALGDFSKIEWAEGPLNSRHIEDVDDFIHVSVD